MFSKNIFCENIFSEKIFNKNIFSVNISSKKIFEVECDTTKQTQGAQRQENIVTD